VTFKKDVLGRVSMKTLCAHEEGLFLTEYVDNFCDGCSTYRAAWVSDASGYVLVETVIAELGMTTVHDTDCPSLF
jgi:hypothetical protein